jgi:hypothetical protein
LQDNTATNTSFSFSLSSSTLCVQLLKELASQEEKLPRHVTAATGDFRPWIEQVQAMREKAMTLPDGVERRELLEKADQLWQAHMLMQSLTTG